MSKPNTKTVKQLQTQANKLLKGIDNSALIIKNQHAKISSYIPELKETMTALSNINAAPKEKTAIKAVKPPVVKPPKTAKAKETKKETGEKHTTRPSLRDATIELLKLLGPQTKQNLMKELSSRFGFNSRPGFYNLIKKESSIFAMYETDKVHLIQPELSTLNQVSKFVKETSKDPITSSVI